MPPRGFRKLLTVTHLLVIMSFVMQTITPLAATAAPLAANNERPLVQEELPVEPEFPPAEPEPEIPYEEPESAPMIPIPEADNPFDPATPPVEIPMDGVWGEGGTADPGPSLELLGTPSLPATPVGLNLELDRYILSPGEEAILSVGIYQLGESADGAVQVTLTLPPQLQIVGDPEASKVWSYNADALAIGVSQTFSISVRDAFIESGAAVVDIWLEASTPDYESHRKRWVVGIPDTTLAVNGQSDEVQTLQSTTGAVLHTPGLTLLAPEDAAPVGVQIQYTPIYTGSVLADEGENLTETIPITSAHPIILEQSTIPQPNAEQIHVYLPSLRQDILTTAAEATNPVSDFVEETEATTSTIPTLEDNGLFAYRLWHLSADGLIGAAASDNAISDEGQDPEHPEFANPVFMVVDVADLAAQGVNMDLLGLWTRPDASQDWYPVPFARYDEERQSWVVWLNHFSDFAIGIAPAANGELLPSMKGYTVDHQTGSVNFSFPINAPSGLGGLNPNLSLNYSSQVANDLYLSLGNDNSDDVQANIVGYGWNLGGMNSIRKFRIGSTSAVHYSLTLNGQSYDIRVREIEGQPDRYDTDPISFAAIKFIEGETYSEWQIKTTDGTLYVFGGTLPNDNWPINVAERNTHIEKHVNLVDSTRVHEVSAWHLSRVEDTMGNMITYTVTTERGAITNGMCLAPGMGGEDGEPLRWYTKAARLTEVNYSGNTGKYGDAVAPTLRVRFEYAPREDNATKFPDHDDCQPRLTNVRLSKIYVEARQYNSTTAWQTIHRYELVHDKLPKPTEGVSDYLRHQQLINIHEYGKDSSATLLNTHTFSYEPLNGDTHDTEYNIHLKTADNGYGGKITYTYSNETIDCSQSACQDNEIQLVTKMQLEDGQGNYYITTFDYIDRPHVRVEENRLIYMGVSNTSSKVYKPTTNPSNLVMARFEEYSFQRGDWNVPAPAEGRLKQMVIRDHSDAGNIPYYVANYVWGSYARNDALAGWYIPQRNIIEPIWTRLERKSEWIGGPNRGFGRQERYFYETNYGSTYGNVIRVDEYSHPNSIPSPTISQWLDMYDTGLDFLRRTKTEYFPNTGWLTNASAPYIVERPARVIVENASGECQAENRTIYANPLNAVQNRSGAYNAAPMTSFVIKTEQVINGCPYADPNPGDREDSNLLVTSYSRDAYGNETMRTSHNGGVGKYISIGTVYDDFYNLFPVERYNNATSTVRARASYYGVNGVAVDGTRGFWGAMRDTCAINNVCSRFGYDQFGRRIHQWDRQAPVSGSSWPTDADAAVRWVYRKAGDPAFPGQTTYIVTEWRAPRYDGNFVRRHYDGLGQVVIEQKSHQNYKTNVDGHTPNDSGPATTGSEIITFFKYDALGNQSEATVPRGVAHDNNTTYRYWDPVADWSIKTQTIHDQLGRLIRTIAPNGEQTDTAYTGRLTLVTAVGRDTGPDAVPYKSLRWTQVNALGYLSLARAAYWDKDASTWKYHAQINLFPDVLGNVTRVQHIGVNSNGSTYVVGENTYTYDQAGRMTDMDDMDMGEWHYVYNRHNQLIRQQNGRNKNVCFYYDSYGRLSGKHFNESDPDCPDNLAASDHENYTYGTSGPATGQLTRIGLREAPGASDYYRMTLDYNSTGQLETESVSYHNISTPVEYNAVYRYDSAGRLQYIDYPTNYTPNNETVEYFYNGMGLVRAVKSNLYDEIVGSVGYDVLGRVGSLRYAYGNDLFLQNNYYSWNDPSNNSNARLHDIRIGTAANTTHKLALGYYYDSYGNIARFDEYINSGTNVSHYFTYDVFNRLRKGTYNGGIVKDYQTEPDGRPTNHEGQTNNYDGTQPYAVDSITIGGNTLAYTRDLTGNVSNREYMNGSTKVTQVLFWNSLNQLARIEVGGQVLEKYWYDADGIRTRKLSGSVHSHYPFPFYEVEGGVATRYYMLNGQPIAFRKGSGNITYLHRDQVGSVVMTTHNQAIVQDRQYYAYGTKRGGDDFAFEQNFTGQRKDDTGLLYYNARYYDPQLGQFISPDSIIPDPTDYFSYNRYLYSRGNPLKYNDPSGHCIFGVDTAVCIAVAIAALKIIDYGWTGYDVFQYSQIIQDPNSSPAAVEQAKADLYRALYVEALEPDELIPLGIPLDDIIRHWDDISPVLAAAITKADEGIQSALKIQPCSFSADTVVMTQRGLIPISQVEEGDLVLAFNEVTGKTEVQPVTDTFAHLDSQIVVLVIDGERIETTPEHPFYVAGKWSAASQLEIGDKIQQLDGTTGRIQAITTEQRPQVMYNLSVAEAHTFFVGDVGLLVHNDCKWPRDYPTKNTKNWSSWYNSERDARNVARTMLGSDPIEVEPYKWRSQDGKWQYRAKPEDLAENHIHLEELDPITGEVLQNLHLRWE